MEEDKKPQRLQGISSRGGRGGARGGRFMPKAVDRRSKEERESSAPAIKAAEPDHQAAPARGKFERRKKKELGVRSEAAGPLAAPSIAGPSRGFPRAPGGASSGGSRGGGGVRVKAEADESFYILANDERVDMAAPHPGIFPLRLPTSDSDKAEAEAPPSVQSENSLVLLKLPDLGLRLGERLRGGPAVKIKSEEPIMDAVMENGVEEQAGSRGYLGRLLVYKSGRLALEVGGAVFGIERAPVYSEDQVIVLDEGAQRAALLGSTQERYLVVPELGK